MKKVVILCLFALVRGFDYLELAGTIGQQCDPTLTAYQVNSFLVSPWPPAKNVNVGMTMSGIMQQTETLKDMGIFVFFNGQSFYQEFIPQSGTYNAKDVCTINFKVYFPPIVPSGAYTVQVKLRNTSNVYLNCWQVAFNI
jgi:hypothetical protein